MFRFLHYLHKETFKIVEDLKHLYFLHART